MAWWLGFHALTAMAWVQALVRELRSCKLHRLAREKKKKKNKSNPSHSTTCIP